MDYLELFTLLRGRGGGCRIDFYSGLKKQSFPYSIFSRIMRQNYRLKSNPCFIVICLSHKQQLLISQNPLCSYPLRGGITKTLPISIFVAFSTVNKVSYKLYRRGLFERQSAMLLGGQASSAVCTKFVETLLTVLRV